MGLAAAAAAVELGLRGGAAQREIKYINMLFGWLRGWRLLAAEAEIASASRG